MVFVVVFWPLIITVEGELELQTAEGTRFVLYCKIYPKTFVGQLKMTLVTAQFMLSRGGGGSVRLNIAP